MPKVSKNYGRLDPWRVLENGGGIVVPWAVPLGMCVCGTLGSTGTPWAQVAHRAAPNEARYGGCRVCSLICLTCLLGC